MPDDVGIAVKWKCTPEGPDAVLKVGIAPINPHSRIMLVDYPASNDESGTATMKMDGDGSILRYHVEVESRDCQWQVTVTGMEQ